MDIPWRASKTILIGALRNFFRSKVLLFFSSKFFRALNDVQIGYNTYSIIQYWQYSNPANFVPSTFWFQQKLDSFLDAKSKEYPSDKGTIHELESFHPCNRPYIRLPHQLYADLENVPEGQFLVGTSRLGSSGPLSVTPLVFIKSCLDNFANVSLKPYRQAIWFWTKTFFSLQKCWTLRVGKRKKFETPAHVREETSQSNLENINREFYTV